MSLWGPAVEAEIEYRQTEARKSWGGGRKRDEKRSGRKRSEGRSRSEQIKEGMAGMRPAGTARGGLFA